MKVKNIVKIRYYGNSDQVVGRSINELFRLKEFCSGIKDLPLNYFSSSCSASPRSRVAVKIIIIIHITMTMFKVFRFYYSCNLAHLLLFLLLHQDKGH